MKKNFDLELIKSGQSDYYTQEINNVEYTAFNYKYLDEFDYKIKETMIGYAVEALKAEDKKINLFGLAKYLDQAMKTVGINFFESKSDVNLFVKSVEKEVNRDLSLGLDYRKNLIKKIELMNSYSLEVLNFKINKEEKIYLETSVSTISLAVGAAASISLYNLLDIPLMLTSPVAILVSLGTGWLIKSLWNIGYDKKIEILKKKYHLQCKLMDNLYEKIKKL